MQLLRITLRAAGVLAVFAGFLIGAAPAGATGTVLIRQSNGYVTTYENVKILISHGVLFLTTSDGKGTLAVHRAACSSQGEILVCYATSATLVQSGAAKPIDLKIGTVYINTTDSPQQLVLSTTKVPANSVLVSLETQIGTYISLTGRIDKVVK